MTTTSDEFDDWAVRNSWYAKPWWKRFWLKNTGQKPNFCDHGCTHVWYEKKWSTVENGKHGYYRFRYWKRDECPECGCVKNARVYSVGVWNSR
jgi:hypothetical protein